MCVCMSWWIHFAFQWDRFPRRPQRRRFSWSEGKNISRIQPDTQNENPRRLKDTCKRKQMIIDGQRSLVCISPVLHAQTVYFSASLRQFPHSRFGFFVFLQRTLFLCREGALNDDDDDELCDITSKLIAKCSIEVAGDAREKSDYLIVE